MKAGLRMSILQRRKSSLPEQSNLPTTCSQAVPGSSGYKPSKPPTAHNVGCLLCGASPPPPCRELCGGKVLTHVPPHNQKALLWSRHHTSTAADAVIFQSRTSKSFQDNNSNCHFIVGSLCAKSLIHFILNCLNHQTSLISHMWKVRLREDK